MQSEKFVESHGGKIGDISIYGQESNPTTRRLAVMNLAIRGIEADFGPEHADTFRRDLHPDLRADYVLANPPFNDSDWFRKDDDVRWQFGVPPKGNANFAWVQHFIHHLAPSGYAGFVLANGSMSSNQSGEGEIRRAMIEADLVDCMVAMPGQLFYSTQIPVCLWFIARDKSRRQPSPRPSPRGRGRGAEGVGAGDGRGRGAEGVGSGDGRGRGVEGGGAGIGVGAGGGFRDRRGQTLFIDARKMGTLVDRVHRELTDADLDRITSTYHAWREAKPATPYADVAGVLQVGNDRRDRRPWLRAFARPLCRGRGGRGRWRAVRREDETPRGGTGEPVRRVGPVGGRDSGELEGDGIWGVSGSTPPSESA